MTTTKADTFKKETGTISVHTENLFPIIKKWLYSEHDIFIRELTSNSHDAIRKLEQIIDLGEFKGKAPIPYIDIQISKSDNTLTIVDTGLGMTSEEVKKYINQIAFSGAEDFLKKYQEGSSKDNQIIGHFGLGFFSAFMVADKVEIHTLAYSEGAKAVHWTCEGQTQFTMEASSKEDIGTEIILHLNEEAREEFLNEANIKSLIEKYSNFIPIEIRVNGKKVNDMNPLWAKDAKDVKDEEYKEFYKKLFPIQEDPLFYIHLNVDYPFKLKGIVYFPKIKSDLEIQTQGRIKLFCHHVFVSDNIVDIIPQYLNLLQGVLDSPDIPLNVSRSFLQKDNNVKKIAGHIVKKIADKLNSIYKNDKETYQKYWEDIHPFIKFGCVSDEAFYDKIKDSIIFKTTDKNWLTLQEYRDKNTTLKDKIIYTSDALAQATYIEQVKKEGIEVLQLESPLDSHFMQQLEMKNAPLKFLRVDSDTGENLLKDDIPNEEDEKKGQEKYKNFIEAFKKHIHKEELDVKVKPLKDSGISAVITISEYMRRFNDMSSLMQGKMPKDLFANHTFIINENNAIVKTVMNNLNSGKDEEKTKLYCQNIYDIALLQQNQLKGDALTEFIKRTNSLLEKS